MESYKSKVKEVVEWMREYHKTHLTGNAFHSKINAVSRAAERGTKRMDVSDKILHMKTIDSLLWSIFKNDTEYQRLWVPDYIKEPEDVYNFLMIAEIDRLDKTMARGYYSLYKEYHERPVVSAFIRATSRRHKLDSLNEGLKILISDIDAYNDSSSVPGLLGLYTRIRDMSTNAPNMLDRAGEMLSDRYGSQLYGEHMTPLFLKKVTDMVMELAVVCNSLEVEYELPLPADDDILMETLDDYIEVYLAAIEKVHSRLYYRRILQVI